MAGRRVAFDRGAYLSEPERPWRADRVVADGIYGDGWTLPHIPVRMRVFPAPGQAGPVLRFLTVSIAEPEAEEPRPVAITSNDPRWDGSIPPATSIDRGTSVCVRADAPAEVEIETPYVFDVYRDPTQGALTGEVDRPVRILIRLIALADETEAVAGCSGDRASSPR